MSKKMKPKSKVFGFFNECKINNNVIYACKYCGHKYTHVNATKMKIHIRKCMKCPEENKKCLELSETKKNKNNLEAVDSDSTETASTSFLKCYKAYTKKHVLDRMEISEKAKIDEAVSKAMYVTGVPLSVLEHPLWIEAFHVLRPSYSPPSRQMLSTTLLDKEFQKVKHQVDENIGMAENLHLCVDGWSNIHNEGILNFIIHTPKPNSYSFVETKRNRITSEYLFSEITDIVETVGPAKFLAVISDNTSNMVKCGALLEEKFEHIVWIGCLAHTLSVMVNDILKLENVSQCFDKTIEIIKVIRQSQALTASFKQISHKNGISNDLHLPVKTKWGSYLQSLESLSCTKIVVQNMAINDEQAKLFKKNLRPVILDDNFWSEIDDLKQFLTPIVKWITVLEDECCGVHYIHKAFSELTNHIEKSCNILSSDENENIKEIFLERKKNALKGVHLAASILDPELQGASLLPSEEIDACETIYNIAKKMEGISEDNVFKELSLYRAKEGLWSKSFLWKSSNMVEPTTWWKTFFSRNELGKVALRILTIPATSASFSAFSKADNKIRHTPDTKRSGKLYFIAHNWKLMEAQETPSAKLDHQISQSLKLSEPGPSSASMSGILLEPDVEIVESRSTISGATNTSDLHSDLDIKDFMDED